MKSKSIINDMTSGPLLSALVRFALPLAFANLLQAVYSMVDMIVVGQFVGAAGLSAVGIGGQLQFLFLAVGMGFGNGGQVVISQQVGIRSKKISETIGTLLSLEFIFAIVLSILGILLCSPILRAMHTPAEAFADARIYLTITCCGLLFIFEYNALCAVLRGMGDSRLPLVFIAIASVLNVILDLLFVAVLKWGAGGAAAATVLAQAVSCVCAAVSLFRRKEALGFDFRPRSFRIDKAQFAALCRLGIPNVVQQLMISGSIAFINSRINIFGVAASACDSVGSKLNSVCNIINGSISTATATMIAQCFGARDMHRVRQAVRACLVINLIWGVVICGSYLLFPKFIFGLFTHDPDVLELSVSYLRYAVIWVTALCTMDAFFALVQGIGFASFNLIVGILDGVVARIGLSLLLGHFMGLPGFWLGNGLAGFVTTISMGFYYLTGWWKKRDTVTS